MAVGCGCGSNRLLWSFQNSVYFVIDCYGCLKALSILSSIFGKHLWSRKSMTILGKKSISKYFVTDFLKTFVGAGVGLGVAVAVGVGVSFFLFFFFSFWCGCGCGRWVGCGCGCRL